MPGQLEIRLPRAHGGKTPARTVLTWAERALEVTNEEHSLQHGRKPYSVHAIQRGTDVLARITVATPEQLARLSDAASERMAFNGDWVHPVLLRADFVPIEMLLSSAPPRTLVRVATKSPVIFCHNGKNDPVLTKGRIFHAALERWETFESAPLPIFSSTEDCEVYHVNGRSVPYQAHILQRGWEGVMDLKLNGTTERIVNGNVLLMYAEMWGIGKATTAGAGQLYLTSVPKSGERRRVNQ